MRRHEDLLTAGEVAALDAVAGKVIAHSPARCPPSCCHADPETACPRYRACTASELDTGL
jgi:hypothetical protein